MPPSRPWAGRWMLFNTRQSQGGHQPAERSFPSLEAWVGRKSGPIDHEIRVAEIADALFNLTRDLHGLGAQDLLTLKSAALVHDVGRAIDPKNHAEVGANLVLEDSALSLRALQRRWLAYLTLYHRGPVPALGEDRILIAEDDGPRLLKLLALLRAADTLDSRSMEPPRLVLRRRGRRVRIWCVVRENASEAREAFCRPKKFRLLEQTLNCRVVVQVPHHEDCALVS
jgi:exopolyphosphatase/pppGpp-phosphohydrolase